MAIHIPVPVIIILRYITGIGWDFVTFPVLIGAFFAGQLLGSQIYLQLRIKSSKGSAIQKPVNPDLTDQ